MIRLVQDLREERPIHATVQSRDQRLRSGEGRSTFAALASLALPFAGNHECVAMVHEMPEQMRAKDGSNAELLTASRQSFRVLSEWAINRTAELFGDLQLCPFIRNPYVLL